MTRRSQSASRCRPRPARCSAGVAVELLRGQRLEAAEIHGRHVRAARTTASRSPHNPGRYSVRKSFPAGPNLEDPMKLKQIAAVGVMTASCSVAGATAAVAADTSNPTPSASTCLPDNHDDTWPASAQGQARTQPRRDASGTTTPVGTCASRTTRSTTACSRVRSSRKGELVNVTRVRSKRTTTSRSDRQARPRVPLQQLRPRRRLRLQHPVRAGAGVRLLVRRTTSSRLRASRSVRGATHPAHDPFVIRRTA